jgi:hypothetical protein
VLAGDGGLPHGAPSEVVPSATDCVTGHPEQCQDCARHQDDDADRPYDGDLGDEPDNEKNEAENDQGNSLQMAAVSDDREKIRIY